MINLYKKFKDIVKKLLATNGYRISKIGPYSVFDFESFLYRHLEVHKTFSFVQIGANDGIMGDPIYNFNQKNSAVVSGYVLEPLPDIFRKLSENYKLCPNVKPVNLAIHATESEMVLHRVKPSEASEVPEWANAVASFDKAHWEKTKLVANSDLMEEVKVSCVSFSDFIESNSIKDLDLLLIDTEGYDYEILMSIDFNHIKPKIIRFEHGLRNGLMSNKNFKNVCNHLNSFGYQIIAETYDANAYLLDPSDLIF